MKTFKKLTAVLLSALMIFSMVSTSALAAREDYLGEAIEDQYNSIDRVVLNEDQQATLILDKLDVMLAKAEIVIELPLIGTIDLTSVDKALDSIYSVTGNWLFGSLTVGDLVVLETNRSDIATIRRTTANVSDLDLIVSVISYLSKCAPTLVDMIDPSADFSWGIVKGFLPPEFRLITDDFNGWLDELLWGILHPVNSEAEPANLTLDDIVQFICDNQIGAEEGSTRALAMGFAGVMPGFTVNVAADSGYRVIEEGIYQALNAFIVPILNSSLKSVIQDAVASNQTDGGDLHDIIDVDYIIDEYNFDRTKGLMEQINNVLGTVVNTMLKPLAERENSAEYDFVWSFEIPAGKTYLDLLETNLKGVMSMIIIAGGETGFNPEGKSLKEIGDYIARIAVDQFVKHMDVPENASMEKMAYLGLRELCASVVPEGYRPAIENGTDAQYRAEVIELAADLGTYFLNNSIGLNCDLSTTADQFLSAFADWCMEYINGLFDDSEYSETASGWDKIDAVIWSVIPKDWLPATAMFGSENGLTFQALVNYILDIIFEFNLSKLNTMLSHNTSSSLAGSARQLIIDFVSNILNGAFTPAGKTSCVPTGINTFEKLISPISNGTGIICNILTALEEDTELQKTVLNLVVMLLGLSNPQSLGDVDIDIDSRINCTSNTANAEMRISNFSSGVNSAWRNTSGTVVQDKMYEIELVSLTNTAGLTATVAEGTIPGRKIAANGYLDVTITGEVENTTEARFDLSYYILDESGARINNGTPLVKSVYTHLYTQTGNYDVMSAEVTANNVTFEAFPTYLYTTNVYNAALFSILATNKSGLITSAVDITKATVTGTLPAGIAANAPTNGVIVAIDDSTATTASYGTVNPYVSNVDPDAAQPYGIYEVSIQFEVRGKNILGSTTTGTTEARAHKIVVFDDFNLGGVLGDVMAENRQRVDYAADATTEWNNYLAAVSAGYALLDGNPDHTKMFTDVNATLAGVQNDYYTKVEAIKAAVAALDLKAITNTAKLAELTTAMAAFETLDRDDYILFTYDRFKKAYNNAKAIVDSQVAPAGQEETFVAPAVKVFDIVYAKNQLTLWGNRLINKTPDTRYLDDEVDKITEMNLVQADYTSDSWTELSNQLTTANGYLASTQNVTQGMVNANRVNLMEALLGLEEASATAIAYILPASGATGITIDHNAKTISGINSGESVDALWSKIESANETSWLLGVDEEIDNVTIGTEVYVYDLSSDDMPIIATYTII